MYLLYQIQNPSTYYFSNGLVSLSTLHGSLDFSFVSEDNSLAWEGDWVRQKVHDRFHLHTELQPTPNSEFWLHFWSIQNI